jgi:lipopolysaccharide export LptBFGC system permease protein LptF
VRYLNNNLWTFENGTSYIKLENDAFPELTTFKEITLRLNEVPDDFNKFKSEVLTLNIFSLANFISRMQKTGINVIEYKVLMYEKIAISILCIVFSLVSLSTLYTPNKRSSSFAKKCHLYFNAVIGFLAHTHFINGPWPNRRTSSIFSCKYSHFTLSSLYSSLFLQA